MSYRLSARRASREYVWSLVIVIMLTAGLTTWIALPSAAYSTNDALSAYADAGSTYLVVSPIAISAVSGVQGGTPLLPVLPESLIAQMRQINGVQSVYPVAVNFTTITVQDYNLTLTNESDNKTTNIPTATLNVQIESAVLGGPDGFPIGLINPVNGRLPLQAEAAFMLDNGVEGSAQSESLKLNSNYTISEYGKNFTATYIGQNEASPLFGSIGVLWNQSFLQGQLGNALYNETFGAPGGFDYVIIQANSIDHVSSVAAQLQNMIASSGTASDSFRIIYDQAAIIALQSIESGTASTYLLVGVFSLVLAVALTLGVSYVGFKRRGWEAGLLLSQGWSWRGVSRYILYYFLILTTLSTLIAIAFSYVLLSHQVYMVQVYGSQLVVRAAPQLPFVLTALPIALTLSVISAWLTVTRLRRQGLDSVLREY